MTAYHPRDGTDCLASSEGPSPAIGRRTFLSALTVGATSLGGCVQRARNLAAPDPAPQVSLTIKTTPADDDPYAIRIAQRLAGHLDAVGVGVEVVPMRNDQLLQDVLVDHAFELYVAAHPGGTDPDVLYPLLHSRYAADRGWQNPFGFVDSETDRLLERQRRRSGQARGQTAAALQRVVAARQPLSVVCFPVEVGAVRSDRFTGWRSGGGRPPLHYLDLERSQPTGGSGLSNRTTTAGSSGPSPTLRVALTDGRPTQNLNPLAVSFRNRRTVTELLYDPLVRPHRDGGRPWLAASWEWERRAHPPVATVTLREGLAWHDGHPITAGDVDFTFRFLADTSLGRREEPVPAPRFRGGESLVEGTELIDEHSVRIEFEPVHPSVAARALTVPLLPAHVWRPRSGPANLGGIDVAGEPTEALVWPNMEPVGSGPFTFQRAVKDETLILERNADHFAWSNGPGDAEPPAYDRLAFRIVPSDGAAVELLAAGEVDATASGVHDRAVPAAVQSDEVRLIDRPSQAFYHVGYNTRRAPVSDRRFRRAVARLIDKERTVREVFGGYADPAASPLARSDWLAPGLEWSGRDPEVPFAGDTDGLDVDRARRFFEVAGYRYDDAGRLVGG